MYCGKRWSYSVALSREVTGLFSMTATLAPWSWWTEPNSDATDIYWFAHGLDFKGAMSDFNQIGGQVALPPRSALGYWWTRWFN